ncbi:hypothetical protein IVA80_25760 [Bradyrhizobium sp. 139]|uniref:hypothetical protein n=1 Tax=Bradyrhizobium sp. 139 TaxID=2782616 RepID=UPI001FFB8B2E|nr:hypothetical protein [Bradyrhizobium sp. 139]MCK1744149.1 hypothetical protein [Bradyrhizobium sp. 139]
MTSQATTKATGHPALLEDWAERELSCSSKKLWKSVAEREGLRGPFSPTTPITSMKQRRSAGYDYSDDYIVDYRSDQHRRIAQQSAAVNDLWIVRFGNLIHR